MLSLLVAAACLIGTVFTQLPPSYTLAFTNTTLGVKYGSIDVVPGQTLDYKVPSEPPTLISPHPLNSTYIAIAVDTTANLSAPIPASLLWFQQDLTFAPNGIASTNTTPQVPYLAPSNVGHAYLVLLYAQPANFVIPSNFPYNAGFRKGFNVTRVAVDFGTPLLEANWFLLGSNCTKGVGGGGVGSETGVLPSGTRVVLSGTAAVFPSRTGGRSPTATATTGVHGKKGMFKRSVLRLRG